MIQLLEVWETFDQTVAYRQAKQAQCTTGSNMVFISIEHIEDSKNARQKDRLRGRWADRQTDQQTARENVRPAESQNSSPWMHGQNVWMEEWDGWMGGCMGRLGWMDGCRVQWAIKEWLNERVYGCN